MNNEVVVGVQHLCSNIALPKVFAHEGQQRQNDDNNCTNDQKGG